MRLGTFHGGTQQANITYIDTADELPALLDPHRAGPAPV
jgi:hypothetical protein